MSKQREIFEGQAIESGKPPEIAAKIVMGRLGKWKKEISLLDQPFVKDTDKNVAKQVAHVSSEHLSGPAKVLSFLRYAVGSDSE